ncbi:MAG: transglutaminase-like domain-containing protein, partial [Promethearchaeota archaeon]
MTEERYKKISSKKMVVYILIILISTNIVTFGITYSLVSLQVQTGNRRYNKLSEEYEQLLEDYQILTGEYNATFENYSTLLSDYSSLCSYIKKQILPVQYGLFAESVRRYYMPIYIASAVSKAYWEEVTWFYRDIILHESGQYNHFTNVSNAFKDALTYGNDTMYLCEYIMKNTFYDWLSHWAGWNLTGNELMDIDMIHQWCVDEIDYEFDENITVGQEYFQLDYAKFPVETAFRAMGDCEDQAILDAAYLESCGFETAIALFHDLSHPTLGAFYHGACMVHIEDLTSFSSMYPSCRLWQLSSSDPYYPNFTWCFLDPTWDTPFGSEPSWLKDYSSLNSDIFT